jgi:hypothetical protein
MSELEWLQRAEQNLTEAEQQFHKAQAAQDKLEQRRKDGKLLYDGWRGTPDWYHWRIQQLDHQNWLCACCGKKMVLGEKIDLPNGDFTLDPDHPTVGHILPKSYFPDLTLEKQNLVMICWACNKSMSNGMAKASHLRHQLLKQLKVKLRIFGL